ncbi:hypothetical protein LTR49_005097 [Elasticomyces elasticus]|nr:hypothetical protein LTR49_005097 [Elasticomyces elasticus]
MRRLIESPKGAGLHTPSSSSSKLMVDRSRLVPASLVAEPEYEVLSLSIHNGVYYCVPILSMEWGAIGALLTVGRLAKEIYDKGFSRAQSAAFGTAIDALDRNLRTLEKVVDNAQGQLPERSPISSQTLSDILGDYGKTLRNCQKLLVERSEFVRNHKGFVTNIRWNTNIQAEVVRLTEQVAFHNTKILLVLQPLELILLKEIREVTGRIETRLKLLEERLDRYFVGASTTTDASSTADDAEVFLVVEAVAERFETAVKKQTKRARTERVSVLEWTNGFILHYRSGIPTLEMSDYLKLLKCIWIMQQIQSKQDTQEMQDPLWKHYISELHKKLLEACQNLRSTSAPVPHCNAILRLPESEFSILPPDTSDMGFAEVSGDSHLTELLNVILSDIDEGAFNVRHDLVVFRNLNGSLQLRTIEVTRTNRQTDRLVQKTDMSFEQAHLTPLYASPEASPDRFIVDVNSNFSPSGGLTVTFRRLEDLLRFQELITGYRVISQR